MTAFLSDFHLSRNESLYFITSATFSLREEDLVGFFGDLTWKAPENLLGAVSWTEVHAPHTGPLPYLQLTGVPWGPLARQHWVPACLSVLPTPTCRSQGAEFLGWRRAGDR